MQRVLIALIKLSFVDKTFLHLISLQSNTQMHKGLNKRL